MNTQELERVRKELKENCKKIIVTVTDYLEKIETKTPRDEYASLIAHYLMVELYKSIDLL